ncbi:nitrate- and nitrite sensing domain-containing protein [Kitasatospora sp. NPDC002227]|uniref:sensor histidine kinase n=1 Tax=Kitasatospora sp. NPDC002227 TaxID=3154773 RepID=UPI003317B71A
MAGPHQATPITGPGESGRGEQAHQAQNTNNSENNADQPEKQSGRARLRGTLNRRRATGLSRFAMRNWRIRTRLIALLLLPVVVALVLGGLRIQASLQNSKQLQQMTGLSDLAKKATDLADALQTERDISAGPIVQKSNQLDEVTNAQKRTDTLSKAFAASADNFDDLDLAGGKALLLQVRKDLNQLSTARGSAYGSVDNIQATVTSYDAIITDLLGITQDIAIASGSTELVKTTRALQQFSLAKEAASMQRALVSAALARTPADMSDSDVTFGIRLRAAEDNALTNFGAIYGDAESKTLRSKLSFNTVIADTDRYSTFVLTANGIKQAQSRTYKDWYDAATVKINAERSIEQSLLETLDGKAGQLQSDADTEAIINGVLIALVLVVAVAGAALVARGMVRSLTRLQAAAEDVAERRLPELVKTLSESDPHDVDVTVEPVGVDSADEIGHVAHAFDMVHSEAVRLAAEQALLRGNINAMFTNLSRRSQGLIQRQLSLISELESREADPDQLANLFKLDHLATRMRRNGENLLVLAGEDPGRRWTRPVPLVDVLRAAASEVEQYERIELAAVPSAEVAGRVVNDLVHLLAELLENATSFSSPQTRVRVTGHALPDGRVLIEIHDTGIGLSPDDLAEINERLASPPTVDVSVSRRMGLFVVGRLSLRHGIRIQLRPSDSGGTTALVMLPLDVTTAGGDQRRGGRPGPAQAKQQRGAGPTPRQQVRAGLGEQALPGRGTQGGPAGALGSGPAATGGRPQLGQAPGGRPAATAGGLPTREVGQALRENAPQGGGQNLFAGPQQRGQGGPAGAPAGAPAGGPSGAPAGQGGLPPRRVPGASGAPAGPGGGLPRRGAAPQGQGRPGQPQAPQGQGRPRPGAEQQPQHGWADQGRQQGIAPAGAAPQGAPGPQRQPQDAATQHQSSAQELPQGRPAPADESTAQFARPRFEAIEIDPRDPLGLGLVEPVLPAMPGPQVQQAPAQPAPVQQPQQPQALPQQAPMALPTASGDQGRPAYQPQRPGTTAPGFTDQQQRPAAAGDQGQAAEQPQAGLDELGLPRRRPAEQQAQQQPQGMPRRQPGQQAQGRPQRPAADQQGGLDELGLPRGQAFVDQQQAQQAQRQDRPATAPGQPQGGLDELGLPRRQPGEQGPGQGRPAGAPQGMPRRQPGQQGPGQQAQGRPATAPGQPQGGLDELGLPRRQPAGGFAEQQGQQQPQGMPRRQPGQQAQGRPAGAPGQRPAPGQQQPGYGQQAPQGQRPQQPQAGPQGVPGQGEQQRERPAAEAPWRPSANDERWRRAEQVREPSTSGLTLSGLPRRTPQANLVSGTAEAAPLTGPQVSRAPEEVRGRLTNLRRGIQQGRQAGAATGTGGDAAQQAARADHQGRPQQRFDGFGDPRGNGGFGEFGPDHQER